MRCALGSLRDRALGGKPANGEGSELRTRLTKVYEDSLAETRAQTDALLALL